MSDNTADIISAVLQAVGAIGAALIVGIAGTRIGQRYTRERDRQDKESRWRDQAIELAKLDLERKLATRPPDDRSPLRPSVLDFLANYRELQELDFTTPKELYLKIWEGRIQERVPVLPIHDVVDSDSSFSSPTVSVGDIEQSLEPSRPHIPPK